MLSTLVVLLPAYCEKPTLAAALVRHLSLQSSCMPSAAFIATYVV